MAAQRCLSFHVLFFREESIMLTSDQPNNLQKSGMDLVLAHTLYAVIGAISLEKGGHIANKVAQERILEPLGLKTVS